VPHHAGTWRATPYLLPWERVSAATSSSRWSAPGAWARCSARAASGLNHPNIITIHEIGEAFGQPYIVMELVDGRTLRDEIGDAPLPARQAIEYAAQIAEGLSRAHAAGIVSRVARRRSD
jgi:hypothetical protein